MSAIKKGLKKVGRFLKKHAVKILIAAAVVFTAGIAAAGMPAFMATMGSKGLLVAVGSTLKTGVIAIGGTLGIGKGVVAGSSALAGNSAAILANSAAGVGTTLANGAAAQALGFGKLAATQGSSIAGGVGGATTQPLGSGITSAYGSGMSTAAGTTAPAGFSAAGGAAAPFAGLPAQAQASVLGANTLTSTSGFNAAAGGASGAAGGAAAAAAPAAAKTSFLNSAVGSALVSGGLNAMSSYMAAKAQEDDDAINAMYGVSPRDGDTSLTPEQVRFASAPENRNSWRPRLMYDA